MASDDQLLTIRTRRTLTGASEIETEMTVHCGRRDRSVCLDDCICCSHCGHVHIDPNRRSSSLICRAMGPSGGPRTARYRPDMASLAGAATGDYRLARRPAAQGTPDAVPIHLVMPPRVLCVTADVSIESLEGLLLDQGISGVPVVDALGRPVGVVSKTDLVREHHENGADGFLLDELERPARAKLGSGVHVVPSSDGTVEDIMTPLPMSLPESASIATAAALMSHEGVHRLPVVSDENRVVGILSAFDLLGWLAAHRRQAARPAARCA